MLVFHFCLHKRVSRCGPSLKEAGRNLENAWSVLFFILSNDNASPDRQTTLTFLGDFYRYIAYRDRRCLAGARACSHHLSSCFLYDYMARSRFFLRWKMGIYVTDFQNINREKEALSIRIIAVRILFVAGFITLGLSLVASHDARIE